MHCYNTGETEAIHIDGLSVDDAQSIGNALSAVRAYGHGNGEVCIPLVNGFFDRLRIAITAHRKPKRRIVN